MPISTRNGRTQGIALFALSLVLVPILPAAVQTWESYIYTAAQERDFVRDYLGPALSRAGMDSVHLCILDHNRDLMDEWTQTIYGDPVAAPFVWGSAMHWYVSDDFAAPARAHATAHPLHRGLLRPRRRSR